MLYELILTPGRPGARPAPLNGSVLLEFTRAPLLDGARALVAQGAAGDSIIQTRWEGSKFYAMRAPVGLASQIKVIERDTGTFFAPWAPFNGIPESSKDF